MYGNKKSFKSKTRRGGWGAVDTLPMGVDSCLNHMVPLIRPARSLVVLVTLKDVKLAAKLLENVGIHRQNIVGVRQS